MGRTGSRMGLSFDDPCSSRTCADGSPRCFATALRRSRQHFKRPHATELMLMSVRHARRRPASLALQRSVSNATRKDRSARCVAVWLHWMEAPLAVACSRVDRRLSANIATLFSCRHAANPGHRLGECAGSSALCERERVELVGRRGLRRHVRQLERRQHPEEHHHHELHACTRRVRARGTRSWPQGKAHWAWIILGHTRTHAGHMQPEGQCTSCAEYIARRASGRLTQRLGSCA